MPFDESLAARIRAILVHKKNIEEKKMFGGLCFLLNGHLLVGVWKDALIARLGPDTAKTALQEPFVRAFDITGRPMRNWVLVEPTGIEDHDQLSGWIECAMKFLKTLPKKQMSQSTEEREKRTEIDSYIAKFPADVQVVLEQVRETIRNAAPDAEEVISYKKPAFRQHGILVYFAAWKNHIGMYPPISGDKTLEKAVARYAGPKDNLQFLLDEPIPLDLIRRIVELRVKQDKEKASKEKAKVTMTHPATIRRPGGGSRIGIVGDTYRFLATGKETEGKYATFDTLVPPGGGPPPHSHTREEESFLVLEGEITFQLGEEQFVAGVGTFLNMPALLQERERQEFQNDCLCCSRWVVANVPRTGASACQ